VAAAPSQRERVRLSDNHRESIDLAVDAEREPEGRRQAKVKNWEALPSQRVDPWQRQKVRAAEGQIALRVRLPTGPETGEAGERRRAGTPRGDGMMSGQRAGEKQQ
jgi:hypothetical protein